MILNLPCGRTGRLIYYVRIAVIARKGRHAHEEV